MSEEVKTEVAEKIEEVKSEAPKEELKLSERAQDANPTKEERAGIAYIYTTPNNTMVHITDLSGNTISRITGGMVTKHARLRSSPTIGMFVAKRAAERAKDLGINALYVRVRAQTIKGKGPGGHAALKSLDKEGFKLLGILDTTRVPRGGPKKKGGKRGRRV